MELRLLGTGAADGIPAMFEDSRVSQVALSQGGRDVRSRTSALLDDVIKIDLPPDTWMQLARDGLTARSWECLIFTHSDRDHLAPAEIQYFLHPFTTHESMPFPIFANDTVATIIEHFYPDWPIEVHRTVSFQPFAFGDYTMTPIRATHTPGEDCHNYIFQHEGVSLLYATDTGWWSDETWEYLSQHQLDGFVIECTDGIRESTYLGHLNLNSCLQVVERLRTQGILRDNGVVVTTHHSHRGELTYGEFVDALSPHSMTAGYDGQVVRISASA